MIRYDSIKKYPRSYYMVNIPLDSLKINLDRYAESQQKFGYKFELNPDFQRGHVWNYEQKQAYMEYLIRGGTSGRDVYFNHPRWQSDYKADMVCLDGLQRITACLEFLNNSISVFHGNFYSDFDMIPFSACMLNFHVLNLKSRKDILYWYIQFNSAGTTHSDEDLSRVIQLYREELSKEL